MRHIILCINLFIDILCMKRTFFFRQLKPTNIIPLDPGYLQLYGAIRTVCMVLLTGVFSVGVASYMQWPLTTCAMAIVFAMVAGVLFRDAYHAEKSKTLTYGVIFTLISYGIASAVAHISPMLGNITFVMVGATCVLFHTQSARMASVGLTAFVFYYLGLLITPSVSGWFHASALVIFSIASFCLFSFVLIPNKPEKNLLSIIKTISQLANQLIKEINQIKHDGLTVSNKIHLNQSLLSLNEYILAAEAQLSLTEMVASVQIRAYLRDLEVAIQLYSQHLQSSDQTLTESHSQAVRDAVNILAEFDRMVKTPEMLTDNTKKHAVPVASSGQIIPLAWQHAFKTWIAGMIGLLIGYQISDQRWYWSMFAVLVIYLGAKTTAEVSVRAAERILGTLLGVAFVGLVSHVIQGNVLLEVSVMLLSVFLWAYFIATNYVIGVMFATSQSLFAYEKLGVDLFSLLPLRIDENIVGSLAILGVAYFVFPIKSHTFEMAKSKVILSGLFQTLQSCQQKLTGADSGNMMIAMNKLDLAIKDWRKVNRPHHIKRLFTWWKDEGINRQSWSVIQHWMRIVLQQMNKITVADKSEQKGQAWMQQYDVITQQIKILQSNLDQGKALSHADLIRLATAIAAFNDQIAVLPQSE